MKKKKPRNVKKIATNNRTKKTKQPKKPKRTISFKRVFRFLGTTSVFTGLITLINTVWTSEPWWNKNSKEVASIPAQKVQNYVSSDGTSQTASVMSSIESISVQSVEPDFPWYIDVANLALYKPVAFWLLVASFVGIVSWIIYEIKNRQSKI